MNHTAPLDAKPNPALKEMGGRLRSSIQLLSAVSNISSLPVRVRDLSQAAKEILTTLVQELEEVDSCSLLLYDPKQKSLALVAASGQADLLGEPRGGYNKNLKFAPGEGIAGTVFLENSPRFWNKEPSGAALVPVGSAATVPESLACMPLTASTEQIGVLNISFVRSKPFDNYRKRDLLLLAGVAANVIQAFLLRLEVNKYAQLLKEKREQEAALIDATGEFRKADENGNRKLDLIIQSCPSPVVAWRKEGDDFVLADYNAAGRMLMEREVGPVGSIVASQARNMGLAIFPNIARCYNGRNSFTEEITFPALDSAGERRFLSSYAYVSPDRIYSFFVDLGENGSAVRASSEEEEELAEMVHQRIDRLELANRDLVSQLATKENFIEELKQAAAGEKKLIADNNLRLKKNLEVVNSLLSLISARAENSYISTVLGESQRQVSSIALIYETIHQARTDFYIDLRDYLNKLIAKLRSMYIPEEQYIEFKVSCDQIDIPVEKAVPVCLIISELASNSVRHAFPGGRDGQVSISMETGETGELQLYIRDNGVGLPEEMDLETIQSPGLSLALGLARKQLGGSVRLQRNGGTGFRISFSI